MNKLVNISLNHGLSLFLSLSCSLSFLSAPLPVPLPLDASWSQPRGRGRGWLSWGDWFISLSLSFFLSLSPSPPPPPLTASLMWKNGKCTIKIGGDQSPPLLCVQCIPFLLLPPPPQTPPLPEFNVMELVNAFPSFPPPPLCGPCKYIIITQVPLPPQHGWSISTYFPLQSPSPMIMTQEAGLRLRGSAVKRDGEGEGRMERKRELEERERESRGDRETDHLCLNDIFTKFFTLTLYTEKERGAEGNGEGQVTTIFIIHLSNPQ